MGQSSIGIEMMIDIVFVRVVFERRSGLACGGGGWFSWSRVRGDASFLLVSWARRCV